MPDRTTTHDWETEEITARCLDEECEWSTVQPNLLEANISANIHAIDTGHVACFEMLSMRRVTRND